jgi:hypothetical protein
MAELSQYQKYTSKNLIKEVERLCKLGVLEQQHSSKWALPLFIVPKKNTSKCFLSTFQEVNSLTAIGPYMAHLFSRA